MKILDEINASLDAIELGLDLPTFEADELKEFKREIEKLQHDYKQLEKSEAALHHKMKLLHDENQKLKAGGTP